MTNSKGKTNKLDKAAALLAAPSDDSSEAGEAADYAAVYAQNQWPLRSITFPHNNDVLFGRGGGTNHHPGNKRYREMVEERKSRYVNATRSEKPQISQEIVQIWRKEQNPPGRFLKLNEKTKKWDDVGYRKAREKTSQALREKTTNVRTSNDQSPEQERFHLEEEKESEDNNSVISESLGGIHSPEDLYHRDDPFHSDDQFLVDPVVHDIDDILFIEPALESEPPEDSMKPPRSKQRVAVQSIDDILEFELALLSEVLSDSKRVGSQPQDVRANSLSDNPLPLANTLLPASLYKYAFDNEEPRNLHSLDFHSSIKRSTSYNAENSATKRDLKMLRQTLEREHSLAAVQLPGASLDLPAYPFDFGDGLSRQISELSLVHDMYGSTSVDTFAM